MSAVSSAGAAALADGCMSVVEINITDLFSPVNKELAERIVPL